MRTHDQLGILSRWGHRARLLLVGGVVSCGPAALAADSGAVATISDIASTVVDELSEDSVVVSNRKAETGQADGKQPPADDLQPISSLSDKEPELAEPQLAPEFQEEESAKSNKLPVKVASNLSAAEELAEEDQDGPSADQDGPLPAVFHGIQPGVSTKQQLLKDWGSPDELAPTNAGELLTFQLEAFRGVQVLVEDGVVALIRINLREPQSPQALAEKMHAQLQEAVEVADEESGRVAAYAYPERGIVMVVDEPDGITPETSLRVSQMVLQPLEAETFCLRAEHRPHSALSQRVADLQRAVDLAPREPHANWMLAGALLDAGRASEAEAAAKQALDMDPENVAYRQRWGETLAAVGKYDDAVLATREVLDAENAPTLIRARALHQMGLLASLGDSSISEKSVQFHTRAIAEADKLATSDNAAQRRAAKRLLVEAHLATAVEISRNDFEDKLNNVAEWVSRASAFAEEAIANDRGDLALRHRVAVQSLAALANFKPANDPTPLLTEVVDTLQTIKADTDDPLWLEQLEWSTGVAYLHALQVEHHRRRPKQALEYAEKAIEYMAKPAESRRDNPQTERLVGKLYFHIGAVHAVHHTQHAEAVKWYERAFPLLMTETPDSELVVPRHEGEALVSMAVSYWDQNDRERAISLTEMGADLLEQGVAGGVVAKGNLSVPYGNLAVMHKKMGNTTEALRYDKLVDSIRQAESEAASATGEQADDTRPGVAQRSTGRSASQTASRTQRTTNGRTLTR